MQCFQYQLMRDYVFGLAREIDPGVERDDLLLDDLLEEYGLQSMDALVALGSDDVANMVQRLIRRLPLAA